MSNKEREEQPNQIGLQLPDYSYEYKIFLENQKKLEEEEPTVIIIDLY